MNYKDVAIRLSLDEYKGLNPEFPEFKYTKIDEKDPDFMYKLYIMNNDNELIEEFFDSYRYARIYRIEKLTKEKETLALALMFGLKYYNAERAIKDYGNNPSTDKVILFYVANLIYDMEYMKPYMRIMRAVFGNQIIDQASNIKLKRRYHVNNKIDINNFNVNKISADVIYGISWDGDVKSVPRVSMFPSQLLYESGSDTVYMHKPAGTIPTGMFSITFNDTKIFTNIRMLAQLAGTFSPVDKIEPYIIDITKYREKFENALSSMKDHYLYDSVLKNLHPDVAKIVVLENAFIEKKLIKGPYKMPSILSDVEFQFV